MSVLKNIYILLTTGTRPLSCPHLFDTTNSSLLLLLDCNSTSFLRHLPSLPPGCELLWEYLLLLLYLYFPVPSMLPGKCWLFKNHLLNWLGLLWRWINRSKDEKELLRNRAHCPVIIEYKQAEHVLIQTGILCWWAESYRESIGKIGLTY